NAFGEDHAPAFKRNSNERFSRGRRNHARRLFGIGKVESRRGITLLLREALIKYRDLVFNTIRRSGWPGLNPQRSDVGLLSPDHPLPRTVRNDSRLIRAS